MLESLKFSSSSSSDHSSIPPMPSSSGGSSEIPITTSSDFSFLNSNKNDNIPIILTNLTNTNTTTTTTTSSDNNISTTNSNFDPDPFLISALSKPRDRFFILRVEQELTRYVKISDENVNRPLQFPSMSSYHRLIVHRLADYFKLGHVTDGSTEDFNSNNQEQKGIVLYRTDESEIPQFRLKEIVPFEDSTLSADVPNLKIMKRIPTNGNGDNSSFTYISDEMLPSNDNTTTVLSETSPPSLIEKREEDYAKARARIFCTTSNSDDTCNTNVGNIADTEKTNSHDSFLSSETMTQELEDDSTVNIGSSADINSLFENMSSSSAGDKDEGKSNLISETQHTNSSTKKRVVVMDASSSTTFLNKDEEKLYDRSRYVSSVSSGIPLTAACVYPHALSAPSISTGGAVAAVHYPGTTSVYSLPANHQQYYYVQYPMSAASQQRSQNNTIPNSHHAMTSSFPAYSVLQAQQAHQQYVNQQQYYMQAMENDCSSLADASNHLSSQNASAIWQDQTHTQTMQSSGSSYPYSDSSQVGVTQQSLPYSVNTNLSGSSSSIHSQQVHRTYSIPSSFPNAVPSSYNVQSQPVFSHIHQMAQQTQQHQHAQPTSNDSHDSV